MPRQNKEILKNQLPENLKLAIAKKIENNSFLKVFFLCFAILSNKFPLHIFSVAVEFALVVM